MVLEDLFISILIQFKKYHPSENRKFSNLSIFQNVKLRILMEKIFLISLRNLKLKSSPKNDDAKT